MSGNSPGAPVSDLMRASLGEEEEEDDEGEEMEEEQEEEAREAPTGRRAASIDDSDDDDDDEEEEEGGRQGAGAPRGTGSGSEAGSDEDDDDEEEEEDEHQVSTAPSARKGFSASTVKEDYLLTYGKKTFGAPDYAFVIIGKPFECKDGEEMGHILASKSPDEWEKIKSKHIYLMNADGHDYMYVCFYVPGSPSEEIDKKRLQPVHRPVCKGLVDRFNNSNISDERRALISRIMNFTSPPDDCGPQINPLAQRYPRYQIEAGSVPTAKQARVSKPRALKSKKGKENAAGGKGERGQSSLKDFASASKPKARSSGSSSREPVQAPAPPAPPQPPSPRHPKSLAGGKRPAAVAASPRDDGSTASTAHADDQHAHRSLARDGAEWAQAVGVKRMRAVSVEDPAKTHCWVGTDGKVYIVETA